MTESVRGHNLGRTYSSPEGPIVALHPTDFTFGRGEFIAVMGPSGSGKSTLLNLLGLLDTASTGELWIEGQRVDNLSPRKLAVARRRHVGFLFQDAGLIERMSVLDNVRLPLTYRRMTSGERRERALQAIRRVGVEHRTGALVDVLSGGERQRVGLARVLAIKPGVVICDEPTASLDEQNSHAVVDHLLEAASDGACVICASHDPVVLSRASRRLLLERGRLSQADQPT